MTIYDRQGNTVITLEVDDSSYRQETLMGTDVLTLNFSLPTLQNFPMKSWCEFLGKRYYVFTAPQVTKNHNREFVYNMQMYASDYLLSTTKMKDLFYSSSTHVYSGSRRITFPYTATPREHLEMIVANLNYAERSESWAVDYGNTIGMTFSPLDGSCVDIYGNRYGDNGDKKVVSFDDTYCIDAIKEIADTYDTEFEVRDVTYNNTLYHLVSLHSVEYHKSNPLQMSYGKDGGFVSGIVRNNVTQFPAIDIMYFLGGEQNIPEHYGQTENTGTTPSTWNGYRSTKLLMPKKVLCFYDGTDFFFDTNPVMMSDAQGEYCYSQMSGDNHPLYLYNNKGEHLNDIITEMPCFITSNDGLSIRRIRHTWGNTACYDPYTPSGMSIESSYENTELYPMRVGSIIGFYKTQKQRQDEGGNTSYYYAYDIFDAETDCPDYRQLALKDEKMSLIFQDGALAGKEFQLNTYKTGQYKDKPVCEDTLYYGVACKRFELCSSEIDGKLMPGDEFEPAAGDHYIIFHCSLPQSYISGIASGAEYIALRETVAEMYRVNVVTYTFNGKVNGLWLKQVWDTDYLPNIKYKDYFAVGQHIRVMEYALFGAQPVLRVTAVKQPINKPHMVEVTLSNARTVKYNWVKNLSRAVFEIRHADERNKERFNQSVYRTNN